MRDDAPGLPISTTQLMRLYKRSLYLIRPIVQADDEIDIVDEFPKYYPIFAGAAELWMLAGYPDRAKQVDAIVTSTYERSPYRMVPEDMKRMLSALEGMETAAMGALTGPDLLIPSHRIEELRQRSDYLELEESRGEAARHALDEALHDVDRLRHLLRRAIAEGLEILYA